MKCTSNSWNWYTLHIDIPLLAYWHGRDGRNMPILTCYMSQGWYQELSSSSEIKQTEHVGGWQATPWEDL